MVMKYLKLADVGAYKKSFGLAQKIWDYVMHWDHFSRNTVGSQFVRSIDSISANIAEGFGRYHRKDKEKFYYNARGSVYESLDWLQKTKLRKLISVQEYNELYDILVSLPKEINALISYTEKNLSK